MVRVYDGIGYFFLSPGDVLSVLALALLAGLRGAEAGRWFDEARHELAYADNLNMENISIDLKAMPPVEVQPPKPGESVAAPGTNSVVTPAQPKAG